MITYKELEELLKKLALYKFVIIGILVIVVGGIFLWYSSSLEGLRRELFRDLGIALVPAGLIVMIFHFILITDFLNRVKEQNKEAIEELLQDKDSELKKKLESLVLGEAISKWGVKNIYKERVSEDVIISIINDAKQGTTIKVLGTALLKFIGVGVRETIKTKIERGDCIFQMLLVDPDSAFIEQRAKEENRFKKELVDDIKPSNDLFGGFINSLLPKHRNKIKRRWYDGPIVYFMIITNNRMLIGFYLRNIGGELRGEHSPHIELEVKNGEIDKKFLDHFNDLWESVTIRTIEDIIQKLSEKDGLASIANILEEVKRNKNDIDEDEAKEIIKRLIDGDKLVITELKDEKIYLKIKDLDELK